MAAEVMRPEKKKGFNLFGAALGFLKGGPLGAIAGGAPSDSSVGKLARLGTATKGAIDRLSPKPMDLKIDKPFEVAAKPPVPMELSINKPMNITASPSLVNPNLIGKDPVNAIERRLRRF